jgi:hypothetical protein
MALATAAPMAAQQINWGGSVRPRFEARDVDGSDSRFFTGMETRVSLARALGTDARIFIQVQDVRLWGEERSTFDSSADAFDLSQGYLELGHRGVSPLWLRAGRQEMEFAEGRLVGTNPWRLGRRSFDGVRGAWAALDGTVVDFFGMQLRESEATPVTSDAAFFGVWSETSLGGGRSLHLFALHDRDERQASTARTTLGTYYTGSTGIVTYRAEGAYQTGEAAGLDVSAWMLAARVGAPVFQGRGDVHASYDYYSGDAAPATGESGAFSDLFGRNHPFFGEADLFGDVPGATNGRGLQDISVGLGWNVLDEGRLTVALHQFLVADDQGLAGSTLADEVDLRLGWPVMTGIDLLTGGAWVSLAESGEAVGLASGNVLFGYVQLRAAF